MIARWVLAAMLVAWPQAAFAQGTDATHQHDSATLFTARAASGTSWLPSVTPMEGWMGGWRGWESMVHGRVFVQALIESGEKHRTGGEDGFQVSSANWGMAAVRRPFAGGHAGARVMLSAEPWTVGDCGFLNLLQTGEVCEGDTIHDRQHPHDLFMELAAEIDRPIGASLRWHAYAALAGEPALGPPGFPHRLSASANPIAPIGHHWLDASHVTFGVITTGVSSARWRGEVSAFNGREPDPERADLDLGALDSWSARVSFAPSPRWVLQASTGHLTEAEFDFSRPRVDVHRTTASAIYHRPLGSGGMWATTVAGGVNAATKVLPDSVLDADTLALLVESTLMLNASHTVFGRAELVGKPAHDFHAHEFRADVFTVGKFQAGYARSFRAIAGVVPGVGGFAAASVVPPLLAPRYNGRVSWSAGLFLRLSPAHH